MKNFVSGSLVFIFLALIPTCSYAQVENVPVSNPVYPFLKRMELKGIILQYHDAVLPISRKEVAEFLVKIKKNEDQLSTVERDMLSDFLVEFHYDITHTTDGFFSMLDFPDSTVGATISSLFSEKEKFLYAYNDTNATFFVDGLLTLDYRNHSGDTLNKTNAKFVQFGGRIRGTVYDKFGYYLQGTNAQYWGSRELLALDPQINQAYTLGISNTQNFDFVEGYVRYDAGILSLQVGRERTLWGYGYGDKLTLSDNPRVFDFIRADAQYKSLKYTFLHGWLLGKKANLEYDTANHFIEPVVADKYFAAHRIEFSFPSLFDIGFQEMAIYSNRSVDLAYLNPVTLMESAQRSREERDNLFWEFDIQTHIWNGWEFQSSIVFDDINFSTWGTDSWQNRYAYQAGIMIVDPLHITNSTFALEYTRIEPYTFSHNRSRDNDYGSLGRFLGHHIGPNADSWYFKWEHAFHHKLRASVDFEIQREGNNVYDASGNLVKNVGGDFLQPHRPVDSDHQEFLGGDFVKTYNSKLLLTYELVNEVFVDFHYQYQQRKDEGMNTTTTNRDAGIEMRFDF